MQDKVKESIDRVQAYLNVHIEDLNSSNHTKVCTGDTLVFTSKLMQLNSVDTYSLKVNPEILDTLYRDIDVKRLLKELLRMFILGYRKEFDYILEKHVNRKTTEHPIVAAYNPWISPDNADKHLSTLEDCLKYLKDYPLWYNIDKITPYIETNNNVMYQTTEVLLALRIVVRHDASKQ